MTHCTRTVGALALALAVPAAAQPARLGPLAEVAVRDIVGATVLARDGTSLGEVERVIAVDGDVLAVVGIGGFFGFGEHDVALPMAEFAPGEAGLRLDAYGRSDLEAMVEYEGGGEELPPDRTVSGNPAPEVDARAE